jgi:phytoene dehydrogenase-like protein
VDAAHPQEDGSAAMLVRSVEATAQSLGPDADAYRRLVTPFIEKWEDLAEDFLGPPPIPPRHPWVDLRFALKALQPAAWLARGAFRGEHARGLFAGMVGHSVQPFEAPATSAIGLIMFVLGHRVGWPLARGGSQRIADALAGYLKSLGGEIVTGWEVQRLEELPAAEHIFLDVTPGQLIRLAGERLPPRYRRALQRFRHGPGIFNVDFALEGAIPWRASECAQAGTVHLGGRLEEIAAGERAVWRGEHPERPYVLVAQQSLFDPTRAPDGKHTVWSYCHVPAGSTQDMTARIEAQIERFAPGFRQRILARHTCNAAEMAAYNPNYIGGDITGGVVDLLQIFIRPTLSRTPYATPLKGVYLCSSSTPPGPGVHGLCGYHAARAALARSQR